LVTRYMSLSRPTGSVYDPGNRSFSSSFASGIVVTLPLAAKSLNRRKISMKSEIHPNYQAVIFRDLASGESFLTRSTLTSTKTLKWEDGQEYPVFDVEISSASHPFYTGKQRIMDAAGRVEKFNSRYKNFGS